MKKITFLLVSLASHSLFIQEFFQDMVKNMTTQPIGPDLISAHITDIKTYNVSKYLKKMQQTTMANLKISTFKPIKTFKL